ncbi:MAG: heavy metal translocating P-type ATPase [Promethearchaeota archaeon]
MYEPHAGEHGDHDHQEEGAFCSTCEGDFTSTAKATSIWRNKDFYILLITGPLLATGLVFQWLLGWELSAFLLFLATTIIAGASIAKAGITALVLRRRLTISFLMTVAAIGSFLIGAAGEGAAVIFLFFLAEFLEHQAGERAGRSIAGLLKLAPDVATIKRNGEEAEVHVHDVQIGDIILIHPGDKIPLDGVVSTGGSSVNQAPITGESLPAAKQEGDEVFAGTINNEGFLEVRVTKLSSETVLSKIVRMVEAAQRLKSPTEKFIDRFAKYYTPAVILLALAVAIIPPFLLGWDLYQWVYRALTLLVTACPCALALSVPIAMVSGITNAARNGVLIKGSRYMEELSDIRIMAMDKTGTLTQGHLVVTDVLANGCSHEELLEKAASLEAYSEHPIAQAILEKAQQQGITPHAVEEFRALPGKGVMGRFNGETIYVGNERLFTELTTQIPEQQVTRLEREGKTVVIVGDASTIIGLIAIRDEIRPTAARTITELQTHGIRPVMLTGDNQETAEAIATQLGIDEVHAELLPQDKVALIDRLTREHDQVAMIGDGVNDAPALAKADVGIAMGAVGSDVAIETADIALMQDDLSKLSFLIRISKKTMGIVKQNVIAALLIKLSLAVLVFPGLVSLWLAVALGDMGLSLAVILNAMRLSLVNTKTKDATP